LRTARWKALHRRLHRRQRPAECFPQELTTNAWPSKLGEIIPSYGVFLIEDAAFTRRVRAETAKVLEIENV
jgi:malate dehydrogenase (quinone)